MCFPSGVSYSSNFNGVELYFDVIIAEENEDNGDLFSSTSEESDEDTDDEEYKDGDGDIGMEVGAGP